MSIGGAWQRAKRMARQSEITPDIQGISEEAVEILEVYDQDYFAENKIPAEIAKGIVLQPGTLRAKVRSLSTDQEFIVPFKDPEAYIFLVHGNGVLLKGLHGTIAYKGAESRRGLLTVTGRPRQAMKNNGDDTVVFDISGML